MQFPIYVYAGQADVLKDVFNSVALIFSSNGSFIPGAVKLALYVTSLAALARTLIHHSLAGLLKDIGKPMLAFMLLFSPTCTVIISDKVSKEQYFVDNVPVILGMTASVPSQISLFLSDSISEQMPNHDYMTAGAERAGPMFGARLLADMQKVRIRDVRVANNVKKFCRQCFIVPWLRVNILNKGDEARKTTNFLEFVRANPVNNFGFYYEPERANRSSCGARKQQTSLRRTSKRKLKTRAFCAISAPYSGCRSARRRSVRQVWCKPFSTSATAPWRRWSGVVRISMMS